MLNKFLLVLLGLVLLAACARIIVQVGSGHEVESTIESKPKTGVGVTVEKKEDKP